jgi:hypothetical protein
LCVEAYRPVFGAAVHADDGAQWNPLLMPLLEWMQRRGCARYVVRWLEASAAPRASMLAVLPQILTPSLLEFLAEPDRTILDHVLAAIAAPQAAGESALGSIVEQTLSRVLARDLRLAPIPYPEPATADACATVPRDEAALPDGPEMTAPRAAEPLATAPQPDVAIPPGGEPTLVEPVALEKRARNAGEQGAFVEPAPIPPRAFPRVLAIPATLHPAVAEALASLLAPPAGEPLAAGIDVSAKGIFVPLALWTHRGLDTGLVVGALHEARLLVLQGTRKVWRGHGPDADTPGLMLSARLLA